MLKRMSALCVVSILTACSHAEVTQDSDGWTVVTPSEDSLVIYVSSSEGIDTNDGLDSASPVQTLAAAYALARSGYPDHILLKRGDVWEQEQFTNNWGLSGRSVDEPLVIGSYGEGARPLLRHAGSCIVNEQNGPLVSFVVFMDLDVYNYAADPESPDFDESTLESGDLVGVGIRWRGGGSDVCIENCQIRGYSIGIEPANRSVHLMTNFTVRRCILHKNRGQGMLVVGQNGMTVEECIIDSNAWRLDRDHPDKTFGGTTRKHGLYITNIRNVNIEIKNCIFHDNGSHAVHFRSGGLCENNLFLNNPISIEVGYPNNEDHPDSTHAVVATVRNNVIEQGNDINSNAPRGAAVVIKDTSDCTVEGNLILNVLSRYTNTYGFQVMEDGVPPLPALGVKIRDNITYNWERGGIRIKIKTTPDRVEIVENTGNYYWDENNPGPGNHKTEDAVFLDPLRNVGQYHRTQVDSKGRFGTTAAFVEFARGKWNKEDWDTQYLPTTVIPWIKEGFELAP